MVEAQTIIDQDTDHPDRDRGMAIILSIVISLRIGLTALVSVVRTATTGLALSSSRYLHSLDTFIPVSD